MARFPGDADLLYDLSVAHTQVGFDFIKEGNPEDALEHYQKSMQIREQLAREHPNDSIFRRALMLTYQHYAGLREVRWSEPGTYGSGALLLQAGDADCGSDCSRSAELAGAGRLRGVSDEVGGIGSSPGGRGEALATLRKSAALLESLSVAGKTDYYQPILATTQLYTAHRLKELGRPEEAQREYETASATMDGVLQRLPEEWDMMQQSQEAEANLVELALARKDRRGSAATRGQNDAHGGNGRAEWRAGGGFRRVLCAGVSGPGPSMPAVWRRGEGARRGPAGHPARHAPADHARMESHGPRSTRGANYRLIRREVTVPPPTPQWLFSRAIFVCGDDYNFLTLPEG